MYLSTDIVKVSAAEDQQDLTLPSSSSASAMDFHMFMNSFANSIFNKSSIFGGLETSMVNGVIVRGIGLDNNGSQLSVTQRNTTGGIGRK